MQRERLLHPFRARPAQHELVARLNDERGGEHRQQHRRDDELGEVVLEQRNRLRLDDEHQAEFARLGESRTLRMNSSCERLRATTWNQPRISRCPTKSRTTSTTAALASANARRSASSPLPSAIAGITISRGTTARSWKSRTPMMSRP